MMKKISSFLLVVAMLLTMSFTASASTGTVKLVWDPASVYFDGVNDAIFEVDIVVTGQTTVGLFDMKIGYNAEKVVPVKEDGTAAAKAEDAVTVYVADFIRYGQSLSAGSIGYSAGGDYESSVDSSSVPEDGVICSFRFKALAAGDTGMALTFKDFTTSATNPDSTAVELTDETVAANMKVLAQPVAPTVTGLAISGTVVEEGTVEATYTFNNGATDEGADTTTGDVSVVTWTVGEETYTGKTLTLTDEMVGLDISVSVEPKADRTVEPNVGTATAPVAGGKVKAISSYVPTATATLPAELIATIDYEPTVELDNTYALAEDASTYAWYVVEASETVNSVEAALAAELGEAVASTKAASFGADLRDNYAVVVVTPVVTVAGETRTGTAVKAAALIKGEPPVVDASAVKTDKELNVNKAIKVVEDKDFTAESKAPEGTSDELTIEYAWYLATVDEVAEFDPEGKDAVSTTNSYKPVKEDLGKFVILYITATDALGISTTVEVKYDLAVAKATGGAPAAGNGASLTTGGNNTEDPGTEEPGTEDPKGEPTDEPSGEPIANGAAAFTDVDKEKYAWAYDSIDALAKSGVIKGMTESTFGPDLPTTNAQVIALAVRIAGLKAEEGATTELVAGDHWVQTEMAAAEANEILGVFGEGAIAIDENTSREVAFTLLYNALKAAGVELPETAEAIEYSDAASIDAACVEAITALTKAGIVEGHGDGTVEPKAPITRAQLAKILGMANALIAK